MAFQFSLKTLLMLRLNEQGRCEQSLAIARRDLALLNDQLHQLSRERTEVVDEIREVNQGQSLDVPRILGLQRCVDRLARELANTQSRIVSASHHVAESVARLCKANVQVQAIQKLEHRKYAEYRAEQLKFEQRELDDLAADRRIW